MQELRAGVQTLATPLRPRCPALGPAPPASESLGVKAAFDLIRLKYLQILKFQPQTAQTIRKEGQGPLKHPQVETQLAPHRPSELGGNECALCLAAEHVVIVTGVRQRWEARTTCCSLKTGATLLGKRIRMGDTTEMRELDSQASHAQTSKIRCAASRAGAKGLSAAVL